MRALASVLVVLLASCGERTTTTTVADASVPVAIADASPSASISVPGRPPLRGSDFPDGVIALTWDDGPDAHTLELARYLHDQHVAATFFVVGTWDPKLSEEPGVGANKLATGYEHIPIDELSKLGHRVAAHTRHHRLLGHATPDIAREEFANTPFRAEQVRMFRPPGGFWTDASKAAFRQPMLADLVGPILWDIDAKDWECSLFCRSDAPTTECEPGPLPHEPRVRASVIAQRYLAQIESQRHGIVLLHDRVGDVGSRYALDVAQRLIPELVKKKYVFAPPILRFGPLTARPNAPSGAVHRADLNGDGVPDSCTATARGIECALSDKAPSVWSTERVTDFTLSDVNDDGRADLCTSGRCALAP